MHNIVCIFCSSTSWNYNKTEKYMLKPKRHGLCWIENVTGLNSHWFINVTLLHSPMENNPMGLNKFDHKNFFECDSNMLNIACHSKINTSLWRHVKLSYHAALLLTASFWPSKFVKSYEPITLPDHKSYQIVIFCGFNGVSNYSLHQRTLYTIQLNSF